MMIQNRIVTIDHRAINGTGERRTRTEWHSLVVWNDLGKWAATLQKGTPLFVEGQLVYEQCHEKCRPTVD